MSTPPPRLPPIQSFDLQGPSSLLPHLPPITTRSPRLQPETAMADAGAGATPRAVTPPLPVSLDRPPEALPNQIAHNAEADHQSQNGDADEGSDGEDREDGDDDDDEDDDEDTGETDEIDSYPWHPLQEDKSLPCEDEISFIESKGEHSALDDTYWKSQTFFDIDDPDVIPAAHGRIDWLIDQFNGTKDAPNKQLIMTSPIVRIGGYDWQIKFYPRGNRTEFLSVYIQCVSMQKPDFVDKVEYTRPPLPVLAGSERFKRRVSVAAQVSVLMYNPAEPRVYEYKTDAHQFHKGMADFGWKYFTRDPRYDFHVRKHGQRQSILRDDSLAFRAYIRIIQEPTGCMWDTTPLSNDSSIAATSLRPFDGLSAEVAAFMLLFHLRPVRELLYKIQCDNSETLKVQHLLDKFLSRRFKQKHLRNYYMEGGRDVVDVLRDIRNDFLSHSPEFDELFTSFEPAQLPICSNRLKTANAISLQEAILRQPSPEITPPVLTLELERQRFDEASRKWMKIENKVQLQDTLDYGNVKYHLYAFVTHTGQLGSDLYTPYVRPGGPGDLWYAYEANRVRCLTQVAAVDRHCGGTLSKPEPKKDPVPLFRTQSLPSEADTGIAYLAMYVRHDHADQAFSMPQEEVWKRPDPVKRAPRIDPSSISKRRGSNENRASSKQDATNNRAPPPPAQGFPPPVLPNGTNADLMDGEDVVMSDVENDDSPPTNLNGTLHPSTSGPKAGVPQKEENEDDADLQSAQHKVISFFSDDFYEGQVILGGIYHGEGHLINTNGDEYIGTFRRGFPSGKGRMVYGATGNTYEGEWLAGEHHGHGRLVERETGNVFEGGWKEGRRHGSFVLRGTVTDDDKQCCQICYDRKMNTAFYDCGHVLACRPCSAMIEVCPICRKRVTARLELFGVTVSME